MLSASRAPGISYDLRRIFNYVHDQIRYVHYFGPLKGAELTFSERSGNDFGQCALFVDPVGHISAYLTPF